MKKLLLSVFAAFAITAGASAVSTDAATTTQLAQTAKQYIGIPYVYGGTSTSGLDCSGYTQLVFKKLGYSLKRTAASQFTQGSAVSKSNLQAGDLVFFNTTGKTASHVGIYLGGGSFIHAGVSNGVSIASLNSSYWKPKYTGARRVVNFTSGSTTPPPTQQPAEVKDAAIDFTVYASRSEIALQLATALGYDTTDTNSSFTDVKSTSKNAGAIAALEREGIFSGDNGLYKPNNPLTRAHLAKALVRAFDLQKGPINLQFKDVASSHWSYEFVDILASTGITDGIDKEHYGPNNYVTLKQLNTFITRVKNYQQANN